MASISVPSFCKPLIKSSFFQALSRYLGYRTYYVEGRCLYYLRFKAEKTYVTSLHPSCGAIKNFFKGEGFREWEHIRPELQFHSPEEYVDWYKAYLHSLGKEMDSYHAKHYILEVSPTGVVKFTGHTVRDYLE